MFELFGSTFIGTGSFLIGYSDHHPSHSSYEFWSISMAKYVGELGRMDMIYIYSLYIYSLYIYSIGSLEKNQKSKHAKRMPRDFAAQASRMTNHASSGSATKRSCMRPTFSSWSSVYNSMNNIFASHMHWSKIWYMDVYIYVYLYI